MIEDLRNKQRSIIKNQTRNLNQNRVDETSSWKLGFGWAIVFGFLIASVCLMTARMVSQTLTSNQENRTAFMTTLALLHETQQTFTEDMTQKDMSIHQTQSILSLLGLMFMISRLKKEKRGFAMTLLLWGTIILFLHTPKIETTRVSLAKTLVGISILSSVSGEPDWENTGRTIGNDLKQLLQTQLYTPPLRNETYRGLTALCYVGVEKAGLFAEFYCPGWVLSFLSWAL